MNLKLRLTPATSATAERSFSCLPRVNTMNHESVSSICWFWVNTHQDMTDLLDLEAVACDFLLALNDYRRNLFGNGSRSEAPDSCQDLVSLIHAERKHCLESCTGLYKVNQQKVDSIAQMSWPSFGPNSVCWQYDVNVQTFTSYCQQFSRFCTARGHNKRTRPRRPSRYKCNNRPHLMTCTAMLISDGSPWPWP